MGVESTRPRHDPDHFVVEERREVVLTCSCGWGFAERTKTAAREGWLKHVARYRARQAQQS